MLAADCARMVSRPMDPCRWGQAVATRGWSRCVCLRRGYGLNPSAGAPRLTQNLTPESVLTVARLMRNTGDTSPA